MNNELKDASVGTPGIAASVSEQKKPFTASKTEIYASLAMCVLAYCYTYTGEFQPGWLVAFTAGFIIFTELFYFGTRHSTESWIWLGCMILICASLLLPGMSVGRLLRGSGERVWGDDLSRLFLHVLAVYWVLCRSGRLCEGESGRLLPLDGLNGFIVFPFGGFFLHIRTLFFGVKQLAPKKDEARPAQVVTVAAAILASIGLFVLAAQLLGKADKEFSALLDRLTSSLRFDWDGECFLRWLLSIPVAAYLFGLVAGAGRAKPDELRAKGSKALEAIAQLRRVPATVWTVVMAAFTAMYAVFFFLQGSYLFGAFTRTLPEGFIVSEYARQGFFELCKVMAVNFVLLWCVTRSGKAAARENRGLLIMCAVMLAEGMLFAVIAFSKLALYIDCFGFTPLRLQSSWLVCVLLAGNISALITLLTGRKTLRLWLIFSGITLTLLHLY